MLRATWTDSIFPCSFKKRAHGILAAPQDVLAFWPWRSSSIAPLHVCCTQATKSGKPQRSFETLNSAEVAKSDNYASNDECANSATCSAKDATMIATKDANISAMDASMGVNVAA